MFHLEGKGTSIAIEQNSVVVRRGKDGKGTLDPLLIVQAEKGPAGEVYGVLGEHILERLEKKDIYLIMTVPQWSKWSIQRYKELEAAEQKAN